MLRSAFHCSLLDSGVLSRKGDTISNADKSSQISKRLARLIFDQIYHGTKKEAEKLLGQTAGSNFESICADFLENSFKEFKHLRPGEWIIGKDGVQGGIGLVHFAQFRHLAELEKVAADDPTIRAALGSDYLIKPDVLIARQPLEDAEINGDVQMIDSYIATHTPLRRMNSESLLLHATVSCKWTMRSDRAQNARTEALNLMKNRKGRVPHIAVITAEPTPGRLASLAFGTGEIDCVYHFALNELVEAIRQDSSDDQTLLAMIEGDRLRDVSDLPLDLVT